VRVVVRLTPRGRLAAAQADHQGPAFPIQSLILSRHLWPGFLLKFPYSWLPKFRGTARPDFAKDANRTTVTHCTHPDGAAGGSLPAAPVPSDPLVSFSFVSPRQSSGHAPPIPLRAAGPVDSLIHPSRPGSDHTSVRPGRRPRPRSDWRMAALPDGAVPAAHPAMHLPRPTNCPLGPPITSSELASSAGSSHTCRTAPLYLFHPLAEVSPSMFTPNRVRWPTSADLLHFCHS